MSPLEERKQLIARLKDYFDGTATDPGLDEYEITEAYDFAGDSDDVALQERIMGYGLRNYPDFVPLLARNVLLLYDLGDKNKAAELADKIDPSNVLVALYRVLVAIDGGEDAESLHARLEAVLAAAQRLGEEEVIEFIDTAMETDGGYEWIKEHFEALRSKCEFLPGLLYEMALTAKDENKPEDAEKFIEELTMIEPFETDYWEMLAEVHFNMQLYDEAAGDVEYALAINPHAPGSRVMKANLRLIRGEDVDDVIESIRDLIFSDQLETFPLYVAISALDGRGKKAEAGALLLKFLKRFPSNRRAIDYLLYRCSADVPDDDTLIPICEEALETYHRVGSDNSELYWLEWAREHYDACDFNGAAAILRVYSRHCQLRDNLLYLQALYMSNRAGDALDVVISRGLLSTTGAAEAQTKNIDHSIICLIFIMGMVRSGHDEMALKVIDFENQICLSCMQPGNTAKNIAVIGYREILSKIKKGIKNGTYPDEYDPLLMPQNLKKSRRRGGRSSA